MVRGRPAKALVRDNCSAGSNPAHSASSDRTRTLGNCRFFICHGAFVGFGFGDEGNGMAAALDGKIDNDALVIDINGVDKIVDDLFLELLALDVALGELGYKGKNVFFG